MEGFWVVEAHNRDTPVYTVRRHCSRGKIPPIMLILPPWLQVKDTHTEQADILDFVG